MNPTETAALVSRARNGDAQAFAALYHATNRHIFFLCSNMLRNEQDAEDVMQETYLKAFQNLHQLQEPEKFRSWLSRIAVNQCRNLLKKNVPLPVEEELLEQPETEELVLPEEHIFSREKRRILLELMQRELSGLQYQTVLLYYFEQYSVSEVAALMDCTENAVKNRLSVARDKIRKGIGQYETEYNDKLYSSVPFLTLLLSEAAKSAAPPALEHVILSEAAKLSAIGNSVKTIAAAERMGSHMLHTKLIVGACAVIIAAGGVGAVLHLQKKAPHTLIAHTSSAAERTPDEPMPAASAPAGESIAPGSEALPEETEPEEATVFIPEDSSLYDKGLEIIALMDEECRNESYLALYATDSLLESEAFARVQNGDHSAPQRVYKATLPEENAALLLSLEGADFDSSALSEPLDAFLRSRLLKNWFSVLNARMGVDYVAAGSIITAEKLFVSTEAEENCIYIYTYENACPAAVIYTVGEGGAVMASGQFILAEFETGSAEEVAQSLLGAERTGYGLSLFEVEEIG